MIELDEGFPTLVTASKSEQENWLWHGSWHVEHWICSVAAEFVWSNFAWSRLFEALIRNNQSRLKLGRIDPSIDSGVDTGEDPCIHSRIHSGVNICLDFGNDHGIYHRFDSGVNNCLDPGDDTGIYSSIHSSVNIGLDPGDDPGIY